MLCGFLAVYILLLIKNQYFKKENFDKTDYLWSGIILLDPFLNLSMHEGRMDLMALVFMLLSIYYYLKTIESKSTKHYMLIGFFTGLAVLTTPRVGFISVALFITMLLNWHQHKIKIQEIAIMAIPFIFLVGIWIYNCGGIFTYLNIWGSGFDASDGGNKSMNYLFSNLYIPRHEYVLISIVIIFIIWGIVKKTAFFNFHIIQISLFSILLFYILVKDWGPYSVFIILFYYMIFMHLYYKTISRYKYIFIIVLLLFNSLFGGLKATQTMMSAKERDQKIAAEFVKNNIPKGSRIIGDATYYYAAIQNNCKYQYIDKYGTLENRERKLNEIFKYQYIIISDIEKRRCESIFTYFAKHKNLKLIARLNLTIPSRIPFISNFDEKTYSSSIYKVIE